MPKPEMSPRDRLTGAVVRAAMAIPRPAMRLVNGPALRVDGQELHPEVRMLLACGALRAGVATAARRPSAAT